MKLPPTLALAATESVTTQQLTEALRENGVCWHQFASHSEALSHAEFFNFPFYILSRDDDDIPIEKMIGVIRKRTGAGILVLAEDRNSSALEAALSAGADMFLPVGGRPQEVILGITAIHRRTQTSQGLAQRWGVDHRARVLLSPDGSHIPISRVDLALMERFTKLEAGEYVSREDLYELLHIHDGDHENLLSSTVYRLRRRVAKITSTPFPLKARHRGYVFLGTLENAL